MGRGRDGAKKKKEKGKKRKEAALLSFKVLKLQLRRLKNNDAGCGGTYLQCQRPERLKQEDHFRPGVSGQSRHVGETLHEHTHPKIIRFGKNWDMETTTRALTFLLFLRQDLKKSSPDWLQT